MAGKSGESGVVYDVPLVHGVCGGGTGWLKSVHCHFVPDENPAMPSLRVIAHGSRRAASNDEVGQLSEQVRAQPNQAYDHVEMAFMALAEPSIPEGLEVLASWGATDRGVPVLSGCRNTRSAGYPRCHSGIFC